jgi:hypothetical protein
MAFVSCPPQQSCSVLVYLGNGNGTFQQSTSLNLAGGGPVVAGDFNADGHQDLAVAAFSEVEVFLGDGNGQFQSPLMVSEAGVSDLVVGDFYNDRIQSLAAVNVVVNADQTLSAYVYTIRYSNGQLVATTPKFVMKHKFLGVGIAAGDINGDFKDDLFVTGGYGYPTQTNFSGYMLGNGNGAFGAMVSVPTHNIPAGVNLIRDLNLDSRHDVGLAWSNPYPNGGGALVLINTDATTNCDPPPADKLSVHICSPTSGETVNRTFTFKAAGNAFNGIAQRMELWIDGAKTGQNLEDQLKITTTLAPGTHTATFIAVDSFDDIAKEPVTFTVR